ncbi:MAG: UDP-N-acetylmuramate dehydrogenase [Candidatus Aminicenantes bacterium]|nr:UDP-N-acetylmuramate dehydrogenase [Candidatus Aminicenantes bacterium]
MTALFEEFEDALGIPPRRGVLLSEHSSFRIGGPADFFFTAETLEELTVAVRLAVRSGVRHFVMGGGTNILFDDAGFRGLVIKNAASGLFPSAAGSGVEAVSGTRLADLVEFSVSRGLRGLEHLAGIPGTVGGAVFGNAGAFGRSIGEKLESAALIDRRGRERLASRDEMGFAYRKSALRADRSVLLKAAFILNPDEEDKIREDISCLLEQRSARHPDWSVACAGCYFKNPVREDGTRLAAGKLLEEIGAGSLSRGGAAVSGTHCNFIVNRGGATASDVRGLAEELKRRVRERFGLNLEEEVIVLPADG